MLNQLIDLEEEDIRYGLPVNTPAPTNYNLVLVWPAWKPKKDISDLEKKLKPASDIREKLAKLGVFR